MNKILLIGNSGFIHNTLDGQTTKTRIYIEKIKQEGHELIFVDLEDFLKHPFKTLRQIRKSIPLCDRIVLLSAERGTRILVPFINRLNRKHKKTFILPLIGTSVLHYSIDSLSDNEKNDFLLNKQYHLGLPKKSISNSLKKIDLILPETSLIAEAYQSFYGLDNVKVFINFREEVHLSKNTPNSNKLRIVYLSRVMRIKGIFDLLDCIKEINVEKNKIELDIYGLKDLSLGDDALFNSFIDEKHGVRYLDQVDMINVVSTLSKYDLFVFPTKCIGEGTPGVIAESLLAGTPILSSNFPQASNLMKDGFDAIFYDFGDVNDLKNKLIWAIENKNALPKMRKNVAESGKRFTYQNNRDLFLEYICGERK